MANCVQAGRPRWVMPFIQNTAPDSMTKAPMAPKNGQTEGGRMW